MRKLVRLGALVGGYDFHRRTFNRATQAWRQPGSTFKPFIYSAARPRVSLQLLQSMMRPISLPGMGSGGRPWEPKNSDGRYAGYISMHSAGGFKHGHHPSVDDVGREECQRLYSAFWFCRQRPSR